MNIIILETRKSNLPRSLNKARVTKKKRFFGNNKADEHDRNSIFEGENNCDSNSDGLEIFGENRIIDGNADCSSGDNGNADNGKNGDNIVYTV